MNVADINTTKNPTVRVSSADKDAMFRIAEIGSMPARERTAALREWQIEQQKSRAVQQG